MGLVLMWKIRLKLNLCNPIFPNKINVFKISLVFNNFIIISISHFNSINNSTPIRVIFYFFNF